MGIGNILLNKMLEFNKLFTKVQFGEGAISKSTFNISKVRGDFSPLVWNNASNNLINTEYFTVSISGSATNESVKVAKLYADDYFMFEPESDISNSIKLRYFADLIPEIEANGKETIESYVFGNYYGKEFDILEATQSELTSMGVYVLNLIATDLASDQDAMGIISSQVDSQYLNDDLYFGVKIVGDYATRYYVVKTWKLIGKSYGVDINSGNYSTWKFKTPENVENHQIALDVSQHQTQVMDFTNDGTITTVIIHRFNEGVI